MQCFRIFPTEGGWQWSVLDPFGRPFETGRAKTRAIAAALVIRALVRRETKDPAAGPRIPMKEAA